MLLNAPAPEGQPGVMMREPLPPTPPRAAVCDSADCTLHNSRDAIYIIMDGYILATTFWQMVVKGLVLVLPAPSGTEPTLCRLSCCPRSLEGVQAC